MIESDVVTFSDAIDPEIFAAMAAEVRAAEGEWAAAQSTCQAAARRMAKSRERLRHYVERVARTRMFR